jgi:hypothetical protein
MNHTKDSVNKTLGHRSGDGSFDLRSWAQILDGGHLKTLKSQIHNISLALLALSVRRNLQGFIKKVGCVCPKCVHYSGK